MGPIARGVEGLPQFSSRQDLAAGAHWHALARRGVPLGELGTFSCPKDTAADLSAGAWPSDLLVNDCPGS